LIPVPDTEPTPAELRETAAAAEALADRIDDLVTRLRAAKADEAATSTYLLTDGASQARQTAHDLLQAAAALARSRTARSTGVCGIPWGVCPEHGNTLTSSGGHTQCRSSRCGRQWTYDRLDAPCTEPVSHEITDQEGMSFRACTGHAMDAAQRLIGAAVVRIDT
jgi:hypothetical protein